MNPSTQVMAWPRVCLEGPGVVPEVDSYPKDNLFLPWTWAPVWNIQSLYMPGGGAARDSRVRFCRLVRGRLGTLFLPQPRPWLCLLGELGVHRKRCLEPQA